MKLGKQLYLVHERAGQSQHRIRIVPELKDALVDWTSSTRVSPVFVVSVPSGTQNRDHEFRGANTLLFVGPVHPEEIITACASPPSRMWVGFGLLNVIVETNSKANSTALLKFARNRGLAIECWRLKGNIVQTVSGSDSAQVGDIGARLGRLSAKSAIPEVREALHEYCPLMASSIARSGPLPRGIHDNLVRTQEYIEGAVKQAAATEKLTPYRLLGQLLMVNAGLSRFSSQTFAGTVPISETECHFWTHSLLGIGVPSIGLWKITDFLEKTLGRAQLPERFATLGEITANIPDLCTLDVNDPFWTADHLGRAKLGRAKNNGTDELFVPLLAYFSARDGFRSTSTTISAPLASVASCNSPRWSLLTLTHEVSHILVRAMLASLYPDFEDAQALESTLELLELQQGRTLLDEIRRYFFISILMIDKVHANGKGRRDLNAEELTKLLGHWHREIEETFVHVFDFLYFYGKDVSKYINGIWASWGTIPNITTRVPDYVIRTISAVLANHLRRPKGEEAARELVVHALTELQQSGAGGSYVDVALTYISEHWADEIKPRVNARRSLVKIAQTFFFSESIATLVRREPEISGGATEKEGYTLRQGHLDLRTIRNPLRFLELYSISVQPSPAESLWIYYVLSFCVTDPI
jgi:hypothetical protein